MDPDRVSTDRVSTDRVDTDRVGRSAAPTPAYGISRGFGAQAGRHILADTVQQTIGELA